MGIRGAVFFGSTAMGRSRNQLRETYKKKGKLFIVKKPPKTKGQKRLLKHKTSSASFQKLKQKYGTDEKSGKGKGKGKGAKPVGRSGRGRDAP